MIGLTAFRKRRAAILGAVVIMVPIALMLFATLLVRLQISYRETSRHQQRVQARLLAEAALAVCQDNLRHAPDAPLEIEGRIEGVGGDYRVMALSADSAAPYTAQGAVTHHQWRTVSEITLRIVDEGAGLKHAQPLAYSRQLVPAPSPEK